MSRTKVSALHEQRPGESREWEGRGLVEAAFEGRLERNGRSLAARARRPADEAAPAEEAVTRGAIPLHVSGGAGQTVVRLVEARSAADSGESAVRSGLMRALGFLAVVLGVLLLLDFLRP